MCLEHVVTCFHLYGLNLSVFVPFLDWHAKRKLRKLAVGTRWMFSSWRLLNKAARKPQHLGPGATVAPGSATKVCFRCGRNNSGFVANFSSKTEYMKRIWQTWYHFKACPIPQTAFRFCKLVPRSRTLPRRLIARWRQVQKKPLETPSVHREMGRPRD